MEDENLRFNAYRGNIPANPQPIINPVFAAKVQQAFGLNSQPVEIVDPVCLVALDKIKELEGKASKFEAAHAEVGKLQNKLNTMSRTEDELRRQLRREEQKLRDEVVKREHFAAEMGTAHGAEVADLRRQLAESRDGRAIEDLKVQMRNLNAQHRRNLDALQKLYEQKLQHVEQAPKVEPTDSVELADNINWLMQNVLAMAGEPYQVTGTFDRPKLDGSGVDVVDVVVYPRIGMQNHLPRR